MLSKQNTELTTLNVCAKQPGAQRVGEFKEFLVYSAGLAFTLIIAWYYAPMSFY